MAFKMKSPLKNYQTGYYGEGKSKPLKFIGGVLGGSANLAGKVGRFFGRNRENMSGVKGFAQKAAAGAFGSLFTKKGKIKKY